jgi:hypothetical protein
MTIATVQLGDFLKDQTRKPDWAQLTRLAGDRVAILFEELRRRVGAIDGLVEELFYYGPQEASGTDQVNWGWAPRYRVGETTLFSVTIRPADLEAGITLDGVLRERLLESQRVARGIKEAIRGAPVDGDTTRLRVRLSRLAEVRALASVVLMKSKSASFTR